MENISPMVVSPKGILIPPSIPPVEPAVKPAVVTSMANPCRAIIPYQLEFDDSTCFPSPLLSSSPPLSPLTQKPHTFQVSKGSKKTKPPKAPISNVNPSSVQCFVDASKAFVYQRWKWAHAVSKLSAPHPILVREFYANLDRTVIAEGHPCCVSAFVRGTRIPFGQSTISGILKVELIKNPTYGKQFNPDQTMMGRVLTCRDDYL
uniref:Uncharacterized protein n=1 Tax=Cannabis sativa TaxID=3483 RepID=A0A803Q7B6_CANSA